MVKHKKSITFILVMVMLLSLFAGPGITTEADTANESQEIIETDTSLSEAAETPSDTEELDSPDPSEEIDPEPTPEPTTEETSELPPEETIPVEAPGTEPSLEPSPTEINETETIEETPDSSETKPSETEATEITEPETTEPKETEPPAEPTDHLTYPDGMDAVTASGYANVAIPLVSAARPMMMQSAQVAASSIGGTIGTDHPVTPGEVMLFKQATPVAGMVNTWDVTVRIEAKDSSKTSDIVLVLDRSGSMSSSNRLSSMKTAAKAFVNTLISDPSQSRTRIAIVSFGADVTTHTNFTTNKTTLNNIIDSLTAAGGTYTQAGLRSAGSLIAGSTADKRSIVLLSDGEPTYSTQINNPNNYLIPWTGGNWQTSTAVPTGAYNYSTRVGNASGMRWRYDSANGRYYNHGNSAIAEARFVKNSAANPKIYTIALSPSGESGSVLQNISSGSGYAFTSSPADLGTIFAQIAGALMQGANNASVNDPMGTGFVVSGNVSNITVSKGSATYNSTTKTINWTIGNVDQNAGYAAPHNDVRYAQMTYRIEIDDSILTVPTPADGLYETNKATTLSYTDIDGNQTTGNFPIPKVDPVLLIVEKRLLDANGNAIAAGDGRIFTINVKNSGGTAYDHNYPVQVGQRKVLTNLRYETTYKVTEPAIGGTPASSPSDYETTFNIYGNNTDTFTVSQGSADTTVLVTNKERALGELVVKKVFDPIVIIDSGGGATPVGPDFAFKVTGPGGFERTFTLKAGESETLNGLTYGTYSVVETNTNGFIASYSDTQGNLTDGNVNISIDSKSHTVTVTNSPEVAKADIVAKKIYKAQDGGPESNIAPTFILFADGQPVNPTTHPYTVTPNTGQHSEFTYTWANMPIYNANGSVIVYSVDEIDVPRFTKEINGMTITNTFGGGETRNITAVKVWVNGGETKPTVWFKLYRYIFETQTEADAVEVSGAEIKALPHGTVSVTWNDLPIDSSSTETYRYLVKEVTTTGEDFTPAGYEKTENGLIVTNTFVPSKTDVTAQKVWEGGPADDRPDIWLGLFRSLDNGMTLERVPGTDLKQPETNAAGQLVATWPDVEETSLDNKAYTFHVREFQDADGNVPFESALYEVTLDGLTVTNTYIPPTIPELKARKIWEGGPSPRPLVGFRLYRETVGVADSLVAVPGVEVKMLVPPGTVEVSWFDLPETDNEGRLYIYSVREVIIKPNDDPTAPPEYLEQAPLHYIATYTDSSHNDGITVTNTYQIPTDGEATAIKTWSVETRSANARPCGSNCTVPCRAV